MVTKAQEIAQPASSLSTRARNGLRGLNLEKNGTSELPTAGRVRVWRQNGDFKKTPNIGKKTLNEIDQWLSDVLGARDFQADRFILLPPSAGVDANWHVTDSSDTCVAHCFGFGHSVVGGEDLGLRIVAALNYCRGKTTRYLLDNPGAAPAEINQGGE